MKKILVFLLLLPTFGFGQDVEVKKISNHVYQYTAWEDIGSWGRVGCNGLIVVDQGQALLIDTPIDELKTKKLLSYITDSLHSKLTFFLPGHWHVDCVGGLAYLKSIGITTYANQRTNNMLRQHQRPMAQYVFQDSLMLHLGTLPIACHYLGGGHTPDNIVVWIPSEKILFGGCMVKDLTATSLGNTADASPLKEWYTTIERVQNKFTNVQIVVPGHGKIGGTELLKHTKMLLTKVESNTAR